jgi:type IV secretory pathway TrbD component
LLRAAKLLNTAWCAASVGAFARLALFLAAFGFEVFFAARLAAARLARFKPLFFTSFVMSTSFISDSTNQN